MTSVQLPALQLALALARAHALPHAPQLAMSVVVSTSHPLPGCLSQSLNPALHTPSVQLPALQVATALAKAHALPHAPQLATSALVSSSHPLPGCPSQSAKGALHIPRPQIPTLQLATAL